MFCDHDKHPLYGFIKRGEEACCVWVEDPGNKGRLIDVKWKYNKHDGDYIALALNLVFDNISDAEARRDELIKLGKLIEKGIIKGTLKAE